MGRRRSGGQGVGRSAASHASETLSDLGKVVSDKAALAGERLGDAYGDVARGAARSTKETAA